MLQLGDVLLGVERRADAERPQPERFDDALGDHLRQVATLEGFDHRSDHPVRRGGVVGERGARLGDRVPARERLQPGAAGVPPGRPEGGVRESGGVGEQVLQGHLGHPLRGASVRAEPRDQLDRTGGAGQPSFADELPHDPADDGLGGGEHVEAGARRGLAEAVEHRELAVEPERQLACRHASLVDLLLRPWSGVRRRRPCRSRHRGGRSWWCRARSPRAPYRPARRGAPGAG